MYTLRITEEAVQSMLKDLKTGSYKELLEYSFTYIKDNTVELKLKIASNSEDGSPVREIHFTFTES